MEISRLRLVLDQGNQGWILEKIASRIQALLSAQSKFECDIQSSPSTENQLNFWMQFTDKTLIKYLRQHRDNNISPVLALVTHVDDCFKLARIKLLVDFGVTLIFMSPHHAKEVKNSLKLQEDFPFAFIASDHVKPSRRFRIGIVSKCYPDHRKNEDWFLKFAREGIFSDSEIAIIGEGWMQTAIELRKMGVPCELYDGVENEIPDYQEIKTFYDSLDLYVYFGFDEGALGSLDAYVFKSDFLVSNQGFHASFEIDEGSLFKDYEEARFKLLLKIKKHRIWSDSVQLWTWDKYILDLAKILNEASPIRVISKTHRSVLWKTNLLLFMNNTSYRKLLPLSVRRLVLIRVPKKILSVLNKRTKSLSIPPCKPLQEPLI